MRVENFWLIWKQFKESESVTVFEKSNHKSHKKKMTAIQSGLDWPGLDSCCFGTVVLNAETV